MPPPGNSSIQWPMMVEDFCVCLVNDLLTSYREISCSTMWSWYCANDHAQKSTQTESRGQHGAV